MVVNIRSRQGNSVSTSDFSSEEFRVAAEFIPHIVWMATPDRLIEYINTQGIDYTGLPADDLYGSKWITVVHPDDVDRVQLLGT